MFHMCAERRVCASTINTGLFSTCDPLLVDRYYRRDRSIVLIKNPNVKKKRNSKCVR